MRNKEIISKIWEELGSNSNSKYNNIHEMAGDIVFKLVNEVMKKESTDNLTTVLIGLNGLRCHFENLELVKNPPLTTQQTSKFPKNMIPVPNKNDISKNKNFFSNFSGQGPSSSKFVALSKENPKCD